MHSQLLGKYQYRWPQRVTTGSFATSMQMLHSNLAVSDILLEQGRDAEVERHWEEPFP